MSVWDTRRIAEETRWEVFVTTTLGRQPVRTSCGLFAFYDAARRTAEEILETWNARGQYGVTIAEISTRVVWTSENTKGDTEK